MGDTVETDYEVNGPLEKWVAQWAGWALVNALGEGWGSIGRVYLHSSFNCTFSGKCLSRDIIKRKMWKGPINLLKSEPPSNPFKFWNMERAAINSYTGLMNISQPGLFQKPECMSILYQNPLQQEILTNTDRKKSFKNKYDWLTMNPPLTSLTSEVVFYRNLCFF